KVKCDGVEYEAGRILVAAGGWTAGLLKLPENVLIPQRVPVHWFDVGNNPVYSLGNFPVNFWQIPVGEDEALTYREFYSLPTTSRKPLVKAAFHNGLAPCDPKFLDSNVSQVEVDAIKTVLSQYIQGLSDQHVESEVCLYTMTTDGDFYLGKIPATKNIYGVALAGHGFKFAPVLGELLADLLTDTEPDFVLDTFSPRRFMS
ncbi:MAG: FAD-dependent oxidoreductase, partial [Desulfocapsaceae bacterium]|nr:FAD-dependent oxidoreductase [Desulfocapsaceae bacterium]